MITLPFPVAWIGAAIAIAQVVALCVHLVRRYPAIPKRVPIGLRFDGRPRTPAAKSWLWAGPIVIALAIAGLALLTALDRTGRESGTMMLFIFLAVAESAWFVQWTIDRQIELARDMTHRIAPSRLLLTLLPILATVAIAIAIGIAQSY